MSFGFNPAQTSKCSPVGVGVENTVPSVQIGGGGTTG